MGFIDNLKEKHNCYYAKKYSNSSVISVMISDNAGDSYLTHLIGDHMQDVKDQSDSFKKKKFNLTSATVGRQKSTIKETSIMYAVWAGGYCPYGDAFLKKQVSYKAKYKEGEWTYINDNFDEMLNIDYDYRFEYIQGLFQRHWIRYVKKEIKDEAQLQTNTLEWFWKAFKYLKDDQKTAGLSKVFKNQYDNPEHNDYWGRYYNDIVGFRIGDYAKAVELELQRMMREADRLVVDGVPIAILAQGDIRFTLPTEDGGDGESYEIDGVYYNTDTRISDRVLKANNYDLVENEERRAALLSSPLYSDPLAFMNIGLIGIERLTNVDPEEGDWFGWNPQRPYKTKDVIVSGYINFIIDVDQQRRDAGLSRPLDDTLTENLQAWAIGSANVLLEPLLIYYEGIARQQLMRLLQDEGGIPPGS